MKRIFNLSSPLGIAMTVAGVVLALSPDARRATRRLIVKGTAAVLGAVDQVREASTTVTHQMAEPAHDSLPLPLASEEQHDEDAHEHAAEASMIHDAVEDPVASHVQH